jgi:hypothetical protein
VIVLRGELIEDLGVVAQIKDEWDDLAVARARPFCSPAWMLAWWRHAAPAGAFLRIAVVREKGELVGIAPFFALEEGMGLSNIASSAPEPRRIWSLWPALALSPRSPRWWQTF